MRAGSYATGKERFPLVLRTDGAGSVAGRGARVRRFEVDDRVWAADASESAITVIQPTSV